MSIHPGAETLDISSLLKDTKSRLYLLQRQAALYGPFIPVSLQNEINETENTIKELELDIERLPIAENEYLQNLLSSKEIGRWASLFIGLGLAVLSRSQEQENTLADPVWRYVFRPELASLNTEEASAPYRIVRNKVHDLLRAVLEFQSVILLGPPGSGKTTALERLAWEMAGRRLRAESDSKIPIFLRMRDFAWNEPVLMWIHRVLENNLQAKVLGRDLQGLLKRGSLLLIFDAVNEIPRANVQQGINRLRQFIAEMPKDNLLVVSCRDIDYEFDFDLRVLEIQPLSSALIKNLFGIYLGERNGGYLFQQANESGLLSLAQIPYFAVMMCYLFSKHYRLPNNRGSLIKSFLNVLFTREREMADREWLPGNVQEAVLSKIAFDTHSVIGSGTTVNTSWIISRVPRRITCKGKTWNIDPEVTLRLAAGANLIEIETDWSSLRFTHELLQEFFAGQELLRRFQRGKEISKLFEIPMLRNQIPRENFAKAWRRALPSPPPSGWELPAILATGSKKDASAVLENIAQINPLLAARCIIEGKAKVTSGVYRRITEHLLGIIRDDKYSLRSRMAAGDLLGVLRDPRIDPPPMILIPEGEFKMGNNSVDPFGNKIEAHNVFVERFAVYKYPVTYQEYNEFVADKGYFRQELWNQNGWRWRIERGWEKPEFWDDPSNQKPNCPVVGVSWYEADAFARWRGKRLPTEAEWEKAASWDWQQGEKREYPWGDDYDPNKLNINDGEEIAGRSTPVGIYHSGMSFAGIMDLAGNVWEWCSSIYAPYPYTSEDGREDSNIESNRVLRGGTFWSEPAFACCSMRFKHFPAYRFDVAGFRLVSDVC